MSYEEKEILFNGWYEKYRKLLFKVADQGTGNAQLAQDLCQQTALIFWNNLDNLAGWSEEERKGWLLRVVGNLVKDHWKRASTRNEILKSEPNAVDKAEIMGHRIGFWQETAASSPQEQLLRQLEQVEFILKLLSAIRSKNEDWYDLTELLFLNDYTQEEAASQLNISLQILRVRLYRMRIYIRENFAEELREELG